MQTLQRYMVLVRGAGDLATGVIARLHRAGFRVLATSTAQPTVIRRAACFARAVYEGDATVDGLQARLASIDEAPGLMALGLLPVVVDPEGLAIVRLRPQVVVDAIVAKRKCGTAMTDAPLVIALGPGFTAGVDCHAVVETPAGTIWVASFITEALLPTPAFQERSPVMAGIVSCGRPLPAGFLRAKSAIGDTVAVGDTVRVCGRHAGDHPLGGNPPRAAP